MGKKLSAYNLYMRKALKGKLAGKTKAQRKAIFRAAARGWNKGKPRSRPRSKPKSGGSSRSSSRTTGGRKVGKGFNTRKLFSAIRMISLVAPAVLTAVGPGTTEMKGQRILAKYTGTSPDGTFRLSDLRQGYEPFFWTSLATYGIPKIVSFVKGLLG